MESRLVLSAVASGVATQVAKFAVGSLPGGDAGRVSTDLLVGYNRAMPQAGAAQAGEAWETPPLRTDAQGRVQVDITTSNAALLAPALTAMGAGIIATLPQYNLIEAYIPWSALPAISNLGDQGLMGIIGAAQPMTSVGKVTSEGVNVMQSDRVQNLAPGFDGTGIKVGVLSDSYNNKGGAAADIASGDLPAAGVQVIQDYPSGGTDEGRAMLQIVHDVAPGASLAFATAFISQSTFAGNIQALANAGAKVITDDIYYYAEPFFQPGIIAQAVNSVVTTNGVSYFSSAGNFASQAYDTASAASYGSSALNFVTATIPGIYSTPQRYFDFDPGPGVNNKMTFTIPANGGLAFSFQWDQPFYTVSGVTSDIDIFLLDHNSGTVLVAGAASNLINQTPYEFFGGGVGPSALQVDLVVQLYAGAEPGRLKFVNYGSNNYGNLNLGPFATNSATITPHAGVATAMAVGEVPFFDQRTPDIASSFGPATFLFDAAGARLAAPVIVAKPDIMAPSGVSTTFFGNPIKINGYPNFFGTSAAAPHAAGVAAQMLQANSSLTPSQVYAALKATADPNIGAGDPNQVGSGLINAYAAIHGAPTSAYINAADGFEAGALDGNWEIYTSGAGRVQVSSANGPNGGAYHLVMDGNANGWYFPLLNESILHVDLAGRENATLTFDQKFFNPFGLSNPTMPATFSGHNDSTGVAFSVDGVNWFRVTSLGGSASTPYSTLSFDLSALAAAVGVTLGADTQIKFQMYNDVSIWAPNLGLAIDNVKVSALSALTAERIDIGAAQRSAVRSITLTLQGNVTTLPAAAFNLKRIEDNQSFPVIVGAPSYAGGVTTVVLTFGGPNLNGTSLPDGRYALAINGGLILDNFGNQIDAANNGVAGSATTLNFFRFFGDSNGDGRVDANDYLAFRAAYLSGNATGANSIYDFNGDGFFSAVDLIQFTTNFTKRKLF